MEPFLEKIPNQVGESFFSLRRVSREMTWGWHFHSEFELCWSEKGYGKRLVGNSIEMFEEDDMVFMGENLPHSFHTASEFANKKNGLYVQNVVIQFKKEIFGKFLHIHELKKINEMLQAATYGFQIKGELKEKLKVIIEKMINETGFAKMNSLLLLLNEIAERPEDCRKLSTLKYSRITNPETNRIGNVFQYLQKNFKKNITLQEVAEVANLTPNAFCKYFKRRTNKSFIEYLNELRINYSCELIMTDKYSIKEIADLTGFNNRSNFNRQFIKLVGKTPSQFSKEYKSTII
ncbi:AraC family transcriptional regulator [Chondrinema litorale]|uniref:AraC family transcriptional regulator n=1 Tax=Chondrinema litorale TaxID=2994555 RepID=UPI002542D18A|nr:AraC family transcriptional regulator [Chondrinema litorale]UZR93846.1 AraC family transcriptional regulator [Chondrinema litorale]